MRRRKSELDHVRTELANLWDAINDLAGLIGRQGDLLREEIHAAAKPAIGDTT
jgi:hypothetical protein